MSNIYVTMVGILNKILNGPISCGIDPVKVVPPECSLVKCQFKIREAEELSAHTLARRYLDEVIFIYCGLISCIIHQFFIISEKY